MVDVLLGMVGVDLRPDLLVTAGHDRIREARHEDAVIVEVSDELSRLGGVPDHERHDGMLPRDRLDADPFQSLLGLLPETPYSFGKVIFQ